MKKYSFIILGLFLFTTIGCKKEEFRPHSNDESNAFHLMMDSTEDYAEDGTYEGNSYGDGPIFGKTTTDTIVGVTDPNRDDDDIKKIKRK